MSPPRKMIDCVPGHEVWTQQDRGLSRDCHGLHSRQILGQIGSNKPPKVLRLEGFFFGCGNFSGDVIQKYPNPWGLTQNKNKHMKQTNKQTTGPVDLI